MQNSHDDLPRPTRSICPSCKRLIQATLYEKANDVWITTHCPQHGDADHLFWKNAGLYRQMKKSANGGNLPSYPCPFKWESFAHMATTLAVDPTLRCNLHCPDCFSQAGSAESPDPPIQEILSRVPRLGPAGFRPNIALVGGESTLRQDVPELVRGLIAKRITPRLNTNGLMLLDPEKRRQLKQAGLRWVILQFDGFSREASIRLRGRDLIEEKLEVIEALARDGFSIHLAVMLAKGVNDSEIGRIVGFAVGHPHIKRLSFYPRSRVGRNEDPADSSIMHLDEVFDAMERGTGGRITRRDIVEMKWLWHRLFQITRHPVFRQRICIAPLVLLRTEEGYTVLNRLLEARAILEKPHILLQVVRSLPDLLSFDRGAYPDSILLVNIEKFYHTDAFDLDEAMNCHHIYLTSQGCVPFCLYNSFFRSNA